MTDHRFDPVAFVFGALAVASGAVVLADRSLTDDARVLLPAGLIAVGLALLVRVMRTSDPRPATATPTADRPPTPPTGAYASVFPDLDDPPDTANPPDLDNPPHDAVPPPDAVPSHDADLTDTAAPHPDDADHRDPIDRDRDAEGPIDDPGPGSGAIDGDEPEGHAGRL